MAQIADYRGLYALQDLVLDKVFELDNDFYLTGGTALHRFYYNLRYSDDLDFFVSNSLNQKMFLILSASSKMRVSIGARLLHHL
jgi:predicted nucleotidyltransferase component of viral defense system